jgi:hypothetical protein
MMAFVPAGTAITIVVTAWEERRAGPPRTDGPARPGQALAVLEELALLELCWGQLSVFPDPFAFEPELLLPPFAVEPAEGDELCANAWVTPTPPITNPLASAAATAVLRIVLVIPITSFPSR